MKKISIGLVISLFCSFVIVIGLGHYYMGLYSKSISLNPKIESEILKDLEFINEDNLFKTTRSKNAQTVLKGHIKWTNIYDEKFSNIYGNHKNWLKSKEHFDLMAQDKTVRSIDVAWLNSVSENYDYWSIFKEDIILNEMSNIPKMNGLMREDFSSELTGVNLEKLRFFAGINFIRELKNKRGIQGLKDYRKIAKIIFSLGSRDASIKASKMLDDEYLLVKYSGIKNWELPSKKLIKAYKRLSWAWADVLKAYYHTGRINTKFIPFMAPEYGICSGVLESAGFNIAKSDYFFDVLPFEVNFGETYKESIKRQNKLFSNCGLESLTSINSPVLKESNPWLMGDYGGRTPVVRGEYLNHSRIPFWRALSYGWHYNKNQAKHALKSHFLY